MVRLYTRLPFIISLFALSITLSLLSLTTETYLIREQDLTYEVPPQIEFFVKELDLPGGLVEARSQIPEGVRIYLLSTSDYKLYDRTGVLPECFIDHERGELRARNPSFILIQNDLGEPIDINVHIKVYEVSMPYAMLSIPSYLAMLAAIALLIVKLVTYLKS